MMIKRLGLEDLDLMKEAAGLLWEGVSCDDDLGVFLQNPYNYVYVGLIEGQVAGLSFAYRLDTFYSKPKLYLHAIDVLDDYQGRGMGRAIMERMFADGKQDGLEEVFLITQKSNEKAVALYDRCGGITCNQDDIVYDFNL